MKFLTRRWLVILFVSLAGLLACSFPASAAQCKQFGGTYYSQCFVAPVRHATYDPITSVYMGPIFPTRLGAVNWAAERMRVHGQTVSTSAWKYCNYGVRYPGNTAPCGRLFGVGFGCPETRVSDGGDAQNSPITMWGFGTVDGQYPNGTYVSCKANDPTIRSVPFCPRNWSAYFEYPSGSTPVWYCGSNPSTYGRYISNGRPGTIDGPSTADRNSDCGACGKNPVNLTTGAKYDMAVDYQNNSAYPIKLVRYYSNAVSGWHFNYNLRVLSFVHEASLNKAQVSILREDGTMAVFNSTNANPATEGSTWTWESPLDGSGARGAASSFGISKPPSGPVAAYALKNLRGEMETYGANGLLASIENEQNLGLVFFYDNEQRLSRIEDEAGRKLHFEYPLTTPFETSWPNPQAGGAPVVQPYSKWTNEVDRKSTLRFYPSKVHDGQVEIIYSYAAIAASPTDNTNDPVMLQSVKQTDGSIIQYLYGETGTNGFSNYLTGIIGADGQRQASYSYVATGDYRRAVAQSTKGVGLRKIDYSQSSTVKDAYGNGFYYTKDAAGEHKAGKPSGFPNAPCPSEVCGGEGSKLKAITWDAYGNPLTKKDYNDRITTITWETPRSLPLTIKQATGTPLERTTTFTWHATRRLPLTKVEPIRVAGVNGTRTTAYAYDANGNLLSETVSNSLNAQTRSQSWTYNALGLVEAHTNARGKISTLTYDIQGNVLTQSNALGQVSTWSSYTYRGLPQKIVSPNGLETLMTYDLRDRPTQIKRGSTAAGFETWNISYLLINKIDRITRPDGIAYKMLYDSAHDLIEVQERSTTDVLLGKRVYTLDLMGRLTKEETFDGNGVLLSTGSKTYNTLSRLVSVKGAQNQATTLTYDADGNVTGVSDPLLHSNTSAVDALGRTISMVDALNKTSTMTYDVQDNLTAAVDARGVSTGYSYNAFNDLLAIYSPDRGTANFSVDAGGNAITTTDARGVEGSVIYDDLDRPTSVSWIDDYVAGSPTGFQAGDKTASYTYDSCTNGIGKLCAKTDWTGTTGYSYDLWGRMVGEAFTPVGETFTLTTGYSYDAFGRQDAFIYPSGKALTVSYGSDGQPTAMSWAGSSLIAGLSYQAMNGSVLGWTWGASGIPVGKATVGFTYDLDGRMTTLSDIEQISLVHDLDDRLTGATHQPSADRDMVYTYDAKHRLTKADNALWSGAVNYGYDFGDNRTSKTWSTDGWQNAYGSASNRLSTMTPTVSGVAGTPQSVSMDAMGNTVNDGTRNFSYDVSGRMVSATSGSSSAVYGVNASGLRVRKSVTGIGATNELVAYDDQRRRVGVYQPDGLGGFTVQEELAYLPGSWRMIATVRGQAVGGSAGTAYPVLSDQLGTPRVVLDPSTGDRRWVWTAKEAFGNQAPQDNPDALAAGNFVFNARFPGQFLDAETGLFHNGYRDYDAKLGRYIQSDPIGLEAGWNTYGYVGGQPTGGIDPLGLYFTKSAWSNADFMAAYKYLSENSPTARRMFGAIAQDPRPIELVINNRKVNRFILGGMDSWAGNLHWDPHSGLECASPNEGRVNPALVLLHEMGHGLQSRNPARYRRLEKDLLGGGSEKRRWTNASEKEVITGWERAAARELGLHQRQAHNTNYPKDRMEYYEAKHPTD